MPEPLLIIGILAKAAVKGLSDSILKKGVLKIKKIWKKDRLTKDNLLPQCIRASKLYASSSLMKSVVGEIAYLEDLSSPIYFPGTAKALEEAFRKWHESQASDKEYIPYLPDGDAAYKKMERALLSDNANSRHEQTIRFIKEQFYEEIIYGLGLYGFDHPIPKEIGQYLFNGWEVEGKRVDWFDILIIQFGSILQAPENASAQKAFTNSLLSDIKADTGELLESFNKIEKQINELSRQIENKLPVNILRKSEDVMALVGRKYVLETTVTEKWQEFQKYKQDADAAPSRESFGKEMEAEREWRSVTVDLQKVEKELLALERFIKSAAMTFSSVSVILNALRLRNIKL